MSLTAPEIRQLVAEVAPVLTGGWIQKAYQPTGRTIVLEIRTPGRTFRLLLSAQPSATRLHLATQPLQNPPAPPAFCQYLRAHLQGARIDSIQQEHSDRIVSLGLTTKDGPRRLVAELTGNKANLLVLDAEHRILKDLNHSKELYGHPYNPPVAPPSSEPRERAPRFDAVTSVPFGLSAAVEAHYHNKESQDAATALRDARATHLRKAMKKLRRRIDAWQADLVNAEKYRHYARYGELLKANLGQIKKGSPSIAVIDYFDEALPQITIPLDPTKSAQGNMDDYFRKQRKYDTAQRELLPRIAQGNAEAEALRAELQTIEQGTWQAAAERPPTRAQKIPSRPRSARTVSDERRGPFRRTATSALFGFAATKPNEFHVSRSATIEAAPDQLFSPINDFHSWARWSPWEKRDPAMQRTHSGAASGQDAIYAWSGNNDVGQGRMEIEESTPPSKVVIKLDFLKPFEAHNTAEFTLVPAGNGTTVTWSMHGPANLMTKVMSIFMTMDKTVGKDFEEGLSNLKRVAEAPAGASEPTSGR